MSASDKPSELPEYEVLDPQVLARYERLEEAIRDRALQLIDSEDLDEVDESAHLLATVLIGIAYEILDESGYEPGKVMKRFLDTVEKAESGELVFIEPQPDGQQN